VIRVSNTNYKVTSKSLEFVKENTLSVTELTRTPKLTEILNKYAGNTSEEIYIIRSNRNKDAVGVLVDYDRFLRLLKAEEIIEEVIDNHMFQVALERHKSKRIEQIPLSEVVQEDDFDIESLHANLDKFELDDE
jgi:hypothetical protein